MSSTEASKVANSHGYWGNRFILSAIIQGAVITILTLIIVGFQLTISNINIIQFLSLTFDGPSKWFFLGYIFYLILIVAIAVTAVFYLHLEVHMGKKIKGLKSVLAGIHLVGMNVGGAGTTIVMIFAGLSGSGILDIVLNETIPSAAELSSSINSNTVDIMEQFIVPITGFAGLLSIGVISGGLTYIMTFFKSSKFILDK
ncbi:MAG: hypothetical protein ACR2F1_08905 [Nitrososphaeraceae archaeon]